MPQWFSRRITVAMTLGIAWTLSPFALIPTKAIALPSQAQANTSRTRFDPSGYYYAVENKSWTADGLTYVNIELSRRSGRMVIDGFVYCGSVFYPIKSIDLTRDQVKLVTVRKKGVSYTLTGLFNRSGIYRHDIPEGGPEVMQGTLTRIESGAVAYRIVSMFRYYGGC